MNRFRVLVLAAASLLMGFGVMAAYTQPLGGSIFPLTFVTQPVTNLSDAYNEMLGLVNAQTVGLSTVYPGTVSIPSSGVDTSGTAFSTVIQGNPLMQDHYDDATAAQLNSVKTIIASQTGRTIYPGVPVVMASGTAAGATSVSLKCSASGRIIGTWPINNLVTNTPVSALSSYGITAGAALSSGCVANDAVVASVTGSNLTTTTDLFINIPYTVQ